MQPVHRTSPPAPSPWTDPRPHPASTAPPRRRPIPGGRHVDLPDIIGYPTGPVVVVPLPRRNPLRGRAGAGINGPGRRGTVPLRSATRSGWTRPAEGARSDEQGHRVVRLSEAASAVDIHPIVSRSGDLTRIWVLKEKTNRHEFRARCLRAAELGRQGRQAMIFDDLSVSLMVASLILGLLTIIIVGSQTREDARSVATWAVGVLVPMLLVSCARIALPGPPGNINGGPGMVAICAALIAAVGLGYRVATLRHETSQAAATDKKVAPGFPDDELA
jgi:hypothetical protein